MSFSTEDAQVIFRDAALLNMTEAGHVWIVTEQALHANNIPEGVLGLQLEHSNDELKHIRVSSYPYFILYSHHIFYAIFFIDSY